MRSQIPDLVMLDRHLPDLSGDEILRFLKADSLTKDVPVIVLSADASLKEIQSLLSAGAHHYLTKPINVQQFLEVVIATLKERKFAQTTADAKLPRSLALPLKSV